jgi:hypothetical protein
MASHDAPVRRPRRGALMVLALSLLAVAVTGCAELPASTKPQALEGNSGEAPGFVQPLPPPGPNTQWSPKDVVIGFLHAGASFLLDRNAAKAYLAPGVNWQPGNVIVVGAVSPPTGPLYVLGRAANKEQSFLVTGPRLATLTPSGQYINSSGTMATYQFTLAEYGHVWRIQSIQQFAPKSPAVPPDSVLLIDQADFQQVFQPRNLYFFTQTTSADQSALDLVPDPVFAPIVGSTVDLAQRLVTGLINEAATESWLSGETTSYFPEGTVMRRPVTVNSSLTATVDLGGTAASEPPQQQQLMYDQLSITLTSSPPVAASVRLEFNGRLFHARPAPSSLVPGVGTKGEPLYYAGQDNSVIYAQTSQRTTAVAGPSQFSAGAGITAIAASDEQQGATPELAIATASTQGCSVAIGTASRKSRKYRTVVLSPHGGPCTTLSWAANGDLWAASGSRIWVVPPPWNAGQLVSPQGVGGPTASVVALKVAPDSTRVALLMHHNGTNSLFLVAVNYGGAPGAVSFGPPDPIDPLGQNSAGELADPDALSWYSPYDLAVLTGPLRAPELYEVPLNGGQGQVISPSGSVPSGTNTISTNGDSIVLGTSAGRILTVSPQIGIPRGGGHGFLPSYPG